MPTPEELIVDFKKAFEDFKDLNKKAIDTKSAENNQRVDKVQDHLDKIELSLKNLTLQQKTEKAIEDTLEVKAVKEFMIKGDYMPMESKAKLIAGDSVQGGYLVYPAMETEIIKKVTEVSPIRKYARVTTLGNRSAIYPLRESLLSGFWCSEQGLEQDSASKYKQGEIAVHLLGVNVPLSQELLEDSFVNMETEVSADVSEAFAQTEGAAFVNGTTANRPAGIIPNTAISRIDTITSGTFASNDLFNLMFEPKSAYANGSAWFGNRKVLREVRKFKGSDGQYLLPTIQMQNIQWSLLGYDWAETPDLTEDVTTAGSQFLIFGNMYKAYRIVDRTGMSVIRDPYSNKKGNMVEFLFKKRVGGKVVLPEALKILKVKA